MADDPVKTPDPTTPDPKTPDPVVTPDPKTPDPKPTTPEVKPVTPDPKPATPDPVATVDPIKIPEPPETKVTPDPDKTDAEKEALFKEFDERQAKKDEATKKAADTQIDNTIKGWYSEYEMMADKAGLPKIEKADDKNDPGIVARTQIIQKLADLRASGQNVTSLSQVLIMAPELRRVAGGNAPISGANTPTAAPSNFKNSEIRNSGFRQLAADAHQERMAQG